MCYTHYVALKLGGNATFGSQFCPGSTAEFECQTTEGSLLWETSSTHANHIFDDPTQSSIELGIFLLQLDGILHINGNVLAVNSTAVVSNVQPSYNGTMLKCSEDADLSIFREAVLRVAGNIMAVSKPYIPASYCTAAAVTSIFIQFTISDVVMGMQLTTLPIRIIIIEHNNWLILQ